MGCSARRAALLILLGAVVCASTIGAAGIAVRCEPVRAIQAPQTWIESWHGVQNALEQWSKLQYYRLYLLPFKGRS